jgi:sucrose-phosphate synthase
MDFSTVVVPDAGDVVEGEVGSVAFSSDATNVVPVSPHVEHPIWGEIMRFFTNPHKPMILALARPDPKKNITTLLKAFGECAPLRELANLVKEK